MEFEKLLEELSINRMSAINSGQFDLSTQDATAVKPPQEEELSASVFPVENDNQGSYIEEKSNEAFY